VDNWHECLPFSRAYQERKWQRCARLATRLHLCRPAEAYARFKLKWYAMTAIEYKGHRIEVSPVGKGCYFFARLDRAIADSPSNLEKSGSEEIVAEAKRIIDARLHDK
jgi:hypothetical protein